MMIVLLGVALLAVAYVKWLDLTRDVPPEYLSEQSIVDPTRNEKELAIHRLTKLDFGLRLGLAIRYEKYKLRNGNLLDIWQLAVDQNVEICFGSKTTARALNGHVDKLKLFLKGASEVRIPIRLFSLAEALAVVIACFVSQIPVHLHSESLEALAGAVDLSFDQQLVLRRESGGQSYADIVDSAGESSFKYNYTPQKDRGVALRITDRVNHRVLATTSFTQGNMVSAVASTLKHLSPAQRLSKDDHLVILRGDTTQTLLKLLTAFVAGAKVSVVDDLNGTDPTILAIPVNERQLLHRNVSPLVRWHRFISFSRLRHSAFCKKDKLRLVYIQLAPRAHVYVNWNRVRAELGAFLVFEYGTSVSFGPILVTDMYDFRTLKGTYGAVAQPNEIKLVNYPEVGDVLVRGYNLGKCTTRMAGIGEKEVERDAEGFVRNGWLGTWGTDGCLYLK